MPSDRFWTLLKQQHPGYYKKHFQHAEVKGKIPKSYKPAPVKSKAPPVAKKYEKGKYYYVTYTDESGKKKTVHTQNPERVMNQIGHKATGTGTVSTGSGNVPGKTVQTFKPLPKPAKKTPAPPPTLTKFQYFQERAEQKRQIDILKTQSASINTTQLTMTQRKEFFAYKTQLGIASKEADKGYFDALKGLKEWHPDTKITPTSKGYKIDYPYEGAEGYYKYKSYLQPGVEKGLGGQFESFGLKLAASFTGDDPLGLASAYYTATGNKEKAEQIKIKAIHRVRSIDSPLSGATWYASMPTTQIGLAAVGGTAIGAGAGAATGAIAGTYGSGSAAMFAWQAGQAAVGGAMIGLTAADIKTTHDTQGPGEALGKGVTTGLAFGAGASAYKVGRNLTYKRAARWGFEKRMMKQGRFDIAEASFIERKYLEPKLGRRKYDQGEIDFDKIATLKPEPNMKEFAAKQIIRRRGVAYGSSTEGTPSSHDFDQFARNLSRETREINFAKSRFNVKSKLFDIKPYPRKGSIQSRFGITRRSWVKMKIKGTDKSVDSMQWAESAERHSESAFELPHIKPAKTPAEAVWRYQHKMSAGRMKDISRSVEIYTRMYDAAGQPEKVAPALNRYTQLMRGIEKNPLVMGKEESLFIYSGKGLGMRFSEFKGKMYNKLPFRFRYKLASRSFSKTMDVKLSLPKTVVKKTPSSLPDVPSPSYKAFTSYSGSLLSSITTPALFGSVSTRFKPSRSFIPSSRFKKYYRPSKSYRTSYSKSYKSPFSPSRSSSKSYRYKSPYRPSSIIPSSISSSYYSPSYSPPSSPPYSPPYSPPSSRTYIPSMFPSTSIGGSGRRFRSWTLWGKKYKYREEGLKMIKLKSVFKDPFKGGLI